MSDMVKKILIYVLMGGLAAVLWGLVQVYGLPAFLVEFDVWLKPTVSGGSL